MPVDWIGRAAWFGAHVEDEEVLLKYDYAENPEDETEKVMIGVSSLISWAANSTPKPAEGEEPSELKVSAAPVPHGVQHECRLGANHLQ